MSRTPLFDGVIFDMGDILYDASVWRRWLCEELVGRGVDVRYAEMVEKWEALLVDVYLGVADYWERLEVLLNSLSVTGHDASQVLALARHKAVAVQLARRPMDGVPETLKRLKRVGVRLAVLSDTESGRSTVSVTLGKLGIRDMFHAIVTSADLGLVKPDPRAFQAALNALGVDVSRAAFVGHDVDELTGSMELGLYSIAFNYDPAAPYDRRIERFEELEQVILH